MVVRTASATDLCTQFDITGTWSFSVPGHSYTAIFHQDSVGMLTGELVYTAADVAEFGYPPGATFPITSGQMSGTEYWHRRMLGWEAGGSDAGK